MVSLESRKYPSLVVILAKYWNSGQTWKMHFLRVFWLSFLFTLSYDIGTKLFGFSSINCTRKRVSQVWTPLAGCGEKSTLKNGVAGGVHLSSFLLYEIECWFLRQNMRLDTENKVTAPEIRLFPFLWKCISFFLNFKQFFRPHVLHFPMCLANDLIKTSETFSVDRSLVVE